MKNNTPRPIINHFAIVKKMNAGNPANKLIVSNEPNLKRSMLNNANKTSAGIPRMANALIALKI